MALGSKMHDRIDPLPAHDLEQNLFVADIGPVESIVRIAFHRP